MCDFVKLSQALPKDAKRVIAIKTGVSYPEITRMFRGMDSPKAQIVLEATKELLNERGIILDPAKYGEMAS